LDTESASGLIDAWLESPDPESRLAVARTLGQLRSPTAVDVLVRLGRASDPAVRSGAVEALGRCSRRAGHKEDTVAQTVARALEDPEASVRARAIDAAARIGLQQEGQNLLRLLQGDPSVEVRERAALATGLLRVPGGEEALIDAARRGEAVSVRAAASLAAGAFSPDSLVSRVLDMPDEGAVRQLLRQRLESDPWYRLLNRKLSSVRGLEARALAASSSGAAQTLLAGGMHRTLDAGERVRLIGGLRALRGEQSVGALFQIVREDPSPEVRTAALTAMSDFLDTEELLSTGSRALGDPSLMVRRAAVNLLAKVTPERVFPKLIRSLHADDDPAVLAAAAEVAETHFSFFRDAGTTMPLDAGQAVLLVRMARFIHHPELSGFLAPFARSSWPEVREAVAELWKRRPDAVESDALEAMIADPALVVRLAAAGSAAAARRYDLLMDMTQDPDWTARRQVAVALGKTAPVAQGGIAVLERLAGDSEMPVRAAAYAARLAQGTPVPLPPGLEPRIAAEAVRDTLDLPSLRETARTTRSEERRLAAGLALALLQDEVAREIARTDPVPAIRHRVGGALELAMPSGGAGQ
jgi:HEAT repeat protein